MTVWQMIQLRRIKRDIAKSLEERKRNRLAIQHEARSEAAKRGWQTRRARA